MASPGVLATCPEDRIRDGKRAVELAKRACELSSRQVATCVETLAAAYAEAGDFEAACDTQARRSVCFRPRTREWSLIAADWRYSSATSHTAKWRTTESRSADAGAGMPRRL